MFDNKMRLLSNFIPEPILIDWAIRVYQNLLASQVVIWVWLMKLCKDDVLPKLLDQCISDLCLTGLFVIHHRGNVLSRDVVDSRRHLLIFTLFQLVKDWSRLVPTLKRSHLLRHPLVILHLSSHLMKR